MLYLWGGGFCHDSSLVEGRTAPRAPDCGNGATLRPVAAPGSTVEYFKGNNPDGKSYRDFMVVERCIPEYRIKTAERYQLLQRTLERFEEAKTFGSLIEVPEEDAAPLKMLVDELEQLVRAGDVMQKPAAEMLLPYVQQAWILAQRYDAVIANPPYMGSKGMNAPLKKFAKDACPNSKSDLFAIFMERAFSLLRPNGYNAQINMQSWMFLSSYEKLREWLLHNATIITMAHMGSRAFDSISGEVVSTTAFVIENAAFPDYSGAYIRLVDAKSEAEKRRLLLEAIQ